MNNLQTRALSYLAKGWSVIPLNRDKKPPFSWDEFTRRRATPDEVIRWFASPEYNIGIVTGPISGLGVIDLDAEMAQIGPKQYNLPTTYTVKSSNGIHLYYKHPGKPVKTCRGLVAPHFDVRGDGGYVVAAGSTHASGHVYEVELSASELPDFPEHIRQLIETTKGEGAEWRESTDEKANWIRALIEKGCEEGGDPSRHDGLIDLSSYWAGKGQPYDITLALLMLWNERNRPPYPADEIAKQVGDIYERFRKGKYSPRGGAERDELVVHSVQRSIDGYLAGLRKRAEHQEYEFPTGFKCIDDSTGGARRGDVMVIAAPTGVGKTSLSINIADSFCRKGQRGLLLSTEMSESEIYDRWIASQLGIPTFNFTTGRLTEGNIGQIEAYSKVYREFKLDICDSFSPDAQAVREAMERVKPDFVIFDNAQMADASAGNRYNELSDFVREFKLLMREYNSAGLLISQLNDQREGQHEPDLSLIRETKVINHIASVILLLWEEQGPHAMPWVNMKVKVSKVRTGGKKGTHALRFNVETNKFEEVTSATNLQEV